MASGKSNAAVIAGILASGAITVAQLVVAAISGSAAVLASGLHSAVDTGNNAMLYLGQRRSTRPPDPHHPFGHGMELYFWTLIVALLMFTIAGGATVAEGVYRVIRPGEMNDVGWNCAVLGIAFCFTLYSGGTALREFLRGKGDHSLVQGLRKVKDPTVMSVLFEDAGSLIGVVIALLGVILGYLLELPVLDGIASIANGLVMAAVAAGLIYQSKTLLVGETANDEVLHAIREALEADEAVEEVIELRTMQMSPKDILVTAKVRFRPELSVGDVAAAVDRVEGGLRHEHPELQKIFIEPGRPRDVA